MMFDHLVSLKLNERNGA